ncbi:MAG: hypothetical protein RJA99_130 [Pseudomonadota bacterium]|jgi:plasmid stabilization system protein ParE
MGVARAKVRVTANFEANLASIERFLVEQDAPQVWETLLAHLQDTVLDHLERYPRIGRPFLSRRGGSIEVLDRIDRIARRFPDAEVREDLLSDWLLLYLVQQSASSSRRAPAVVVHLLAIRHHRQLSFDLPRFWPAEPG